MTNIIIQVDERTSVPIWAVGITSLNACLLGFINLGSATALNDILSVCVSGLYISYMICGVLLLYRRCTRGFIMPKAGSELPALANTAGEALVWDWWHMPGIWGILINAYSIFYMAVILFFSFWPPITPVDYTTMNYSIGVTGGVAIISVIYYLVHAKKEYKGPIIEVA